MVKLMLEFYTKLVRNFLGNKDQGQSLVATAGNNPPPSTPNGITYPELKTLFDKCFMLLEENFKHGHPEKYYLQNALKFKLPNTETINIPKQEISFKTYNNLFASSSADYVQRNAIGNISVNTLNEPTKITLSRLNTERIERLHSALQQVNKEMPEPPSKKRSFAEAFATKSESPTERIKRQRSESSDISR